MVTMCPAVYTRNRNFRLLRSSKLGKTAWLTVAKESKYQSCNAVDPLRPRWSRMFNLLMDSLVCNVLPEQCNRVLDVSSTEDGSNTSHGRQKRNAPAVGAVSGEERYQPSPYPLVDQFISSQLFRGGVQGHIRRWTLFTQGKLMMYDIAGYRWCENVGRHHKSNNIMLIADLRRGVFYQKCHDPDCRRVNFASNELPLPLECNPVGAASAKDITTPSNKKLATEEASPGETNGEPSADRELDSTVEKEVDNLLHNISIEDLMSGSEEESSDELKGLTVDLILDDDDTASDIPTFQEPAQQNDFTLSEREFDTFVASSDDELC